MSKGQTSNMAIGVVSALVILFVGLYAINQVYDTVPEKNIYDYVYNVTSDTTVDYANTTVVTKEFSLGSISTISGETATKEVIVGVNNTNETYGILITTYLNTTNLGTFEVSPNTNIVGNNTYGSVSFVANAVNNITVTCNDTTGQGLKAQVVNVTVNFPRARAKADFGTTFDALITNTSTIFDVLILVLIIVALGVAIAVLRGFGVSKTVGAV